MFGRDASSNNLLKSYERLVLENSLRTRAHLENCIFH